MANSEGHCTWCNFKYERLLLFCHFCGILGHDLQHCVAHFAAIKKDGKAQCQYGDWMRALGGRPRSPPRSDKAGPPRITNGGSNTENGDGGDTGIPQGQRTSPAVAEGYQGKPLTESNNGSSENSGNIANIQQNAPFILGDLVLCKESAIQKVVGDVTNLSNFKTRSDHVTTYTDHAQERDGLSTTKAKPKWSRIVRMEYGPITKDITSPLTQLGKRRDLADNRDEDFNEKPVKQHKPEVGAALRHKSENEESAGVHSHPCRQQ